MVVPSYFKARYLLYLLKFLISLQRQRHHRRGSDDVYAHVQSLGHVIYARVDWPQDESRDQQALRYFRTQKLHCNVEQFLRDSEFWTDLGVHLFQIRNCC